MRRHWHKTTAAKLLVTVLAVMAFALWSAPRAIADALSTQLDSAFAAQNMAQLAAISKAHPDPADQSAIVRSVRRHLDDGEAPDHLALPMAIVLLRKSNLDAALTYLAYYRELIILDGLVCPNQESPGSLLEGTIFLFGRLDHDTSITLDRKERAVDRALALEASTSSARRIDPALCGAGLAAYGSDLDVKLPYVQVPAWTTPTAPYAASAEWRRARARQLPGMRSFLLQFSGVIIAP
jgi:hypothetical protein